MDEVNERVVEPAPTRRAWVTPEIVEIDLTSAEIGGFRGGSDSWGSP